MAFTALPPLDSLRCFVEVAQRLNFRAAAKAVALTPAAVSTRVKQLEDLLGAALFTRTTRRVALTAAGQAFLPADREALVAAERAVLAGRGELGPAPLDVTIGTRHELGMSWVLPALPALRRALPHVTFHLYFGSSGDLLERVAAGLLPCAIGSMKTLDTRLAAEPLHEEAYVLVATPRYARLHPLKSVAGTAAHTLIDANDTLPLAGYLRGSPAEAMPPSAAWWRWAPSPRCARWCWPARASRSCRGTSCSPTSTADGWCGCCRDGPWPPTGSGSGTARATRASRPSSRWRRRCASSRSDKGVSAGRASRTRTSGRDPSATPG